MNTYLLSLLKSLSTAMLKYRKKEPLNKAQNNKIANVAGSVHER